ncbi:MAG: hypothetical protein ABI551_13235, partial [Polyangiaceae bacterium]
ALLLIVGLVAFGRHPFVAATGEGSSDRELASATASKTSSPTAKPPSHHAERHSHPKTASSAKLPNVPDDSTEEEDPTDEEVAEPVDAGTSPMTPATPEPNRTNAPDASLHM